MAKQRRFSFDPASGSFTKEINTVYVKGGKAVQRARVLVGKERALGPMLIKTKGRYVGHKPSASKYLPGEERAKGKR